MHRLQRSTSDLDAPANDSEPIPCERMSEPTTASEAADQSLPSFTNSRRWTAEDERILQGKLLLSTRGEPLLGSPDRSGVEAWRSYCQMLFAEGSQQALHRRRCQSSRAPDTSVGRVYHSAPPLDQCTHAWLVPKPLRIPLTVCAVFGTTAVADEQRRLWRLAYRAWSCVVLLCAVSSFSAPPDISVFRY